MRPLACTLLLVASTSAMAGVKLTKHDLSSAGTAPYKATTETQVCVFCHTPHGASTTLDPLWNHTAGATTFTMYSSATIEMTIATSPGATSLACMSCHDGTIAVNNVINGPGSGDGTILMTSDPTITGAFTNLGTDLSNDHPVGITYNTALDTAFNAVATLPFYGATSDVVECGTCHNPHDNTNSMFLRASNAGSNLCLTCHIK